MRHDSSLAIITPLIGRPVSAHCSSSWSPVVNGYFTGGVVGHDDVLADLVLVEHEAATHRVVLALAQRLLALGGRARP